MRRKDDLAMMNVDREEAAKAAHALRGAFVFSGAREGGDYWWKICQRLEALAKAPSRKAKAEGQAEGPPSDAVASTSTT